MAVELQGEVLRQVAATRVLSGDIGGLVFTVPPKSLDAIRALYVATVCGLPGK
jgi:hypothetical protein